jgi:hypothetical protein
MTRVEAAKITAIIEASKENLEKTIDKHLATGDVENGQEQTQCQTQPEMHG